MPTEMTIANAEALSTLRKKAKAISTHGEYVSQLARALEACVEESAACDHPASELDFGTYSIYRLFEGEVRWWSDEDGHYVAFLDHIGAAESMLLQRIANAGFHIETLLDWQPNAPSCGVTFACDLWCVRISRKEVARG